jgi:hypothetical protein
MEMPEETKKRVAILNKYEETDSLKEFDILHLYDDGYAYPDGYYDSRFFVLIGFNTKTMQKKDLGTHDAIDFWDDCVISKSQVYGDGAFLIKMAHMITNVGNTQMISFRPTK